jgi:molecular chaperone GrpE (heat shock protein)
MADSNDNDGGGETPDFAHAMQSLAAQAEKTAANHARVTPVSPTGNSTTVGELFFKSGGNVAQRSEFLLAVGQMIKPVAVGLESVNRAVMESRHLLAKISEAKAAPAPALDGIAQQLGRIASTDSANQKLFDAMHTELKGYKDGFLFDALQKPFIRDLINLFDDLSALLAQTTEHAEQNGRDDFAQRHTENLRNTISHLLEIFERLDVSPLHTPAGEPVDKRLHRLVGFEAAAGPEEDGRVVRSLRPGFLWREGRCVRPEEIVATKWVAPPAATAPVAGSQPVITSAAIVE